MIALHDQSYGQNDGLAPLAVRSLKETWGVPSVQSKIVSGFLNMQTCKTNAIGEVHCWDDNAAWVGFAWIDQEGPVIWYESMQCDGYICGDGYANVGARIRDLLATLPPEAGLAATKIRSE